LIDAPCTGSGTIRRNPDIRLLLSPEALQQQLPQQQRLLQNLWQHVKPGGTLVYSTCSVFAEENDQMIQSFLGKNKDAHVVPLQLRLGHSTRYGLQLLPTNPMTDGFFYCALAKATSTVTSS
jgi:16S rRNA (cytosine967-C5)-methyltransferase